MKFTWPAHPVSVKFLKPCDVRGTSLDTFCGLCDIASKYPSATDLLRSYDASSAWPSLADDFVSWLQTDFPADDPLADFSFFHRRHTKQKKRRIASYFLNQLGRLLLFGIQIKKSKVFPLDKKSEIFSFFEEIFFFPRSKIRQRIVPSTRVFFHPALDSGACSYGPVWAHYGQRLFICTSCRFSFSPDGPA